MRNTILVVLVVAVIAALGYGFWAGKKTPRAITQTVNSSTTGTVTGSDAPGYALYTDSAKTFSFAFPTDLSPATTTTADIWSAPMGTKGTTFAKIIVPARVQPKTNFVEAWFTVGASADPAAVTGCTKTLSGETATTTAQLGNTTFTKIQFTGAGAGNYYHTTSYRTIHNSQCYAVEYTIHYGNIQNYPAGAVKQFNEASVTATLDEIARSFQFLK